MAGCPAARESGPVVIRAGLIASCILVGAAAPAAAQPVLRPGPWVTEEDALGRFAFLEIDPVGRRLLASHVNDDTADFFDLATNRLIARVEVGPVVSLAADPENHRYFASVQDDKRIAIIDSITWKETGSIALPGESGAILFEPGRRRIYVASDAGPAVWVVDPDARRLVATIAVGSEPGGLAQDAGRHRVYVTGGSPGTLTVIDTATDAVIAAWATAPAMRPRGVASDAARGRVFVAGENGRLVVLDPATGRVVAAEEIDGHTGQIAYDAGLGRLYCAAPEWIGVLAWAGDRLTPLGKASTAATATNVAVDPKTHLVWSTFTDGEDSFARSWIPRER